MQEAKPMEYRALGRTGMRVSNLCFGTMSFGGDADEKASAEMFHACRERGINFFDTANIYNSGRSEEILGNLITDCRDELILCTKVGFPTGTGVNQRGLSRRHIILAIEDSLRRLKTDRLELYFVHTSDADTSVEETLRALDLLVQQGKVLHIAASNWSAWMIAKALGISAREGLARFACVQPMYSLVKRQAEVEILPMAQSERMGVTPFSPLGAGLLTGKYTTKSKPDTGRLVKNEMYSLRYSLDNYYQIAERFSEFAKEHGHHPATLAVAWVMAHPAVTSTIIGARNVGQLEASLAAPSVEMTTQLREEISALSIDPAPATDRLETRLKSEKRSL